LSVREVTELCKLAKVIRSKNSKAYTLIFDIIFENDRTYEMVKHSDAINPEIISKLYDLPSSDVMFTWFDEGRAIKITMPRPVPQASAEDSDQFGGQQYALLLDIEIP
jgi:hypothetical protein